MVAQCQGLNVTGMGVSQTTKARIREVGIRPPGCARQTSGILPVTFDQLSSQASPDHPIVSFENIPVAVAKVHEPAGRYLVDLGNRLRHRLPRFSRRQLSDAIDHLPVTLRAREAKLPPERIPQKIETRFA